MKSFMFIILTMLLALPAFGSMTGEPCPDKAKIKDTSQGSNGDDTVIDKEEKEDDNSGGGEAGTN